MVCLQDSEMWGSEYANDSKKRRIYIRRQKYISGAVLYLAEQYAPLRGWSTLPSWVQRIQNMQYTVTRGAGHCYVTYYIAERYVIPNAVHRHCVAGYISHAARGFRVRRING